MRPLLVVPALVLVLTLGVACGDDDDGGGEGERAEETLATVADDGATGTTPATGGSFCDAAEAFAVASAAAPDATTPDEVEEQVTAMADAAAGLAEGAPDGVDAEPFAEAVDGLRQYAADRDFEVDLGAAAPEYQSGEGAAVVADINGSIAVVDQAVQDECGHFINEVPDD